ncbi:hypothetical protein C8R42DRAFT_647619 [Lentinula raphanica]|nr:hypothetical protein C8R42DRAFT_647619 [Lentinula raphanica]
MAEVKVHMSPLDSLYQKLQKRSSESRVPPGVDLEPTPLKVTKLISIVPHCDIAPVQFIASSVTSSLSPFFLRVAGTTPTYTSTPVEKHSDPPHHHQRTPLLESSKPRDILTWKPMYGTVTPNGMAHHPNTVFCKNHAPRFLNNAKPRPAVFRHGSQEPQQETERPGNLQNQFTSALLNSKAKIKRWEQAKRNEEELNRFQQETRLNVVKPYMDALDPLDSPTGIDESNLWSYDYNQLPSHRYLFNVQLLCLPVPPYAICMDMLRELLDHVIRLETQPECCHRRVWTSKIHNVVSVALFLEWIKGVWSDSDNVGRSASTGAEGEEGEEEDPDLVQHVDRDRRREVELEGMSGETRVGNGMGGIWMRYFRVSNVWELRALMCIPFSIPGSAQFAHALARFRGDTTFGVLTRILNTSLGGDESMYVHFLVPSSCLESSTISANYPRYNLCIAGRHRVICCAVLSLPNANSSSNKSNTGIMILEHKHSVKKLM